MAYNVVDVQDGNKKKKETSPITYTIDRSPLLGGGRFISSTKSGNPIKLQNACTHTHDAKWFV